MKILLLAGTAEARELSERLHQAGIDVISSLAGVTQRPAALPGQVRIGGFGGVDGLTAYLNEQEISHVLDATHPFATQISAHAHEAAKRAGLALLRLVRPPWPEDPAWTRAENLDHAATQLAPDTTVFLSTGRGSLAAFKSRDDVEFLARVIGDLPGEFPLPKGEFVIGKPPFSVEEEMALFTSRGIDALVSRNSGGTGGIEKLVAATRLGLSIVMVARPETLSGTQVETVEDALDWVARQ